MSQRYSTRAAYGSLLRLWIKPMWGNIRLDQIEPLDVEHWLKSLDLAPKTKANIRNLMHLLYECSLRWKLVEANPIELVRQSAKLLKTPRKLTVEEFQKLLDELKDPYRTMVILAGCLGLLVGEILGLQWQDVDLLSGRLHIRRDVYQYVVDEVKTSTSEASLPLAPEVKVELVQWRSQLLGHSNLATTADVYTHTFTESERKAATAIEEAIFVENPS